MTWVEGPGGKLNEGFPWTPGGGGAGGGGGQPGMPIIQQLLSRISALEDALGGGSGGDEGQAGQGGEPFIGSEARPDLSQGAFQEEDDQKDIQNLMKGGAPGAKRLFDTSGV